MPMNITNETLAAIEEAGKRLLQSPRSYRDRVHSMEVDLVTVAEGGVSIAAELRELRAKMERVREIVGPIDCDIWDDGPFVRLRLTHTQARELAELLGGNPH